MYPPDSPASSFIHLTPTVRDSSERLRETRLAIRGATSRTHRYSSVRKCHHWISLGCICLCKRFKTPHLDRRYSRLRRSHLYEQTQCCLGAPNNKVAGNFILRLTPGSKRVELDIRMFMGEGINVSTSCHLSAGTDLRVARLLGRSWARVKSLESLVLATRRELEFDIPGSVRIVGHRRFEPGLQFRKLWLI